MKSFHEKREAVTKGILDAFNKQFPGETPEADFETIWPASKWDRIQTESRSFDIELNFTTGKVISITEEVLA